MTRRQTALFKIPLMIFLGPPEGRRRFDCRDDRAPEATGFLQIFLLCLRCAFLFRGVEEDRGAVLRSDIRSLPVQRRGVVVGKKYVQKCVIGNPCRVEAHLDDFGVSGAIRADLLIGRVGNAAAGVSAYGVRDARRLAKERFDAPETPCTKCGFFHLIVSHCRPRANIGTSRARVTSFDLVRSRP